MAGDDFSSVYDSNGSAQLAFDEDLGPKTNVIVWLMVAISLAIIVIRVFCRYRLRVGLGWDDWVLIASWVRFSLSVANLSSTLTSIL